MDIKKDIRKKALVDRDSLPEEERVQKSNLITEVVLKQEIYRKAENVLLYASFNSEVQTDELISRTIALGKNTLLPVVIPGEKKLIAKRIESLDDVYLSDLGIREPKENLAEVDYHMIDVVIVPGCCFDKKGYRIGYGGGYYDRLIDKLHLRAVTIGLAFEKQIVDTLPFEAHDRKVDMIITEENIYEKG